MAHSTYTPNPGARPDWYADPSNPARIRYWDGEQWSNHTAPRPAGWGGVATGSRRSWLPGWAIALLVMFLGLATLAVVGAAFSVDRSEPDQRAVNAPAVGSAAPTPAPTEAAATTSEPEPTPTETEPPRSVVPRLTGLSREKAEHALTTAGLQVSEVRQVFSPEAPGTVLSQSRKVGASVLTGTAVVLVVAKPYPLVPKVVGRSKSAAVQKLQDAGFKVTVAVETTTSGKDGVVLRQTPVGAVRAKPGSSVTVVISDVVKPVVEQPSQSCTPGYTPCLAPAYDYDCEGGSGDGPKYTGYVTVTGADPYDLDADGDGVACES